MTSPRLVLGSFSIAVLSLFATPAGAHGISLPRTSAGCHTWAPVFRPILPILGAGQIEVALPSYLPRFGRAVYPHAAVLQPPLTYQVWLTRSRSRHIASSNILLEVSGRAGYQIKRARVQFRQVGGRSLAVVPQRAGAFITVHWYSRSSGVTYTVKVPRRFGLSTTLRIARSLRPGALRKTPITSGPAIPTLPPCP